MSRVWIPNLGAVPIIASVSPQPISCLFACFYESVLYVYIFISTCLSSWVASAAWFVFGFVFIPTILFSFFCSCEFNTCLWHGTLVTVIHMTILICLSSFSISMFFILIPAYVYLNMYTHFPYLPYSYTFIAIFICIVLCSVLNLYPSFCFLSGFSET